MSEREDLRVRRTKKALYDAFMKLLCEKSFDDITVNELCEVAGVRRATFYKHYADKFDFLNAYTRLLRDRFDRQIWKWGKPVPTAEYYVEYAKRLVYFVSENSVAIDNICNSNLFPSVLAVIVEQNYIDTCERLRVSVADDMKLPASVEMVATMCTGGVSACVYRWVKEGRKTDPDLLAEQVGVMVKNIISQ